MTEIIGDKEKIKDVRESEFFAFFLSKPRKSTRDKWMQSGRASKKKQADTPHS